LEARGALGAGCAQVKKAGGSDAYARARLNELFQLPVGENVTAAREAVTVPKPGKGQKAAEAISLATAVYVTTPLDALLRHFILRPKRRVISVPLSAHAD